MARYDFLDQIHPVYKACKDEWEKNERRIYGGDPVLDELRRFKWETEESQEGQEHYEARQAEATYINFPDMMATAMVGHLMRQAPQPGGALDMGALGEVDGGSPQQPTEATLLYYNADGVGNDGSQWHNFWTSAGRRAMATGHRWILVEAPEEPGATLQDFMDGRRPYLIEYSPLSVTNWHYEKGKLAYAVIREWRPEVRIDDGEIQGQDPEQQHYYLMVAQGFEGLGEEFKGGGWWLFNPEKKLDSQGTWEKTGGQIPMTPLFYDRSKGVKGRPAMSRPALTELGQVAVSYMNLSSAADFDAWDAAGSLQLILGVSQEAFNTAMKVIKSGSKYAPVPGDPSSGQVPEVHDASQGAVSSQVFQGRLDTKRAEAREVASLEATGSPDSSGESKKAGFIDKKAPVLALMASEFEQAQNTVLYFLEQRFGHASPAASVRWPREFDLSDLVSEISEMFALESAAGARSPTLDAKMLVAAARERGLLPDEDADAIIEEFEESARQAASREAQASAALSQFGM